MTSEDIKHQLIIYIYIYKSMPSAEDVPLTGILITIDTREGKCRAECSTISLLCRLIRKRSERFAGWDK